MKYLFFLLKTPAVALRSTNKMRIESARSLIETYRVLNIFLASGNRKDSGLGNKLLVALEPKCVVTGSQSPLYFTEN